MNLDADGSGRRIPSLVQLCQRVCSNSVDSISSLGDGVRYELVRPILERCDAEQLLRLEETSPHLENDTQDIWKELCYSSYPLAIGRYTKGLSEDDSTSWKEHYFLLREAEAKRLEEASAKLRNQRLVAEERKKEREVKITDRLPPPKRQRTGWGSSPAPKTLFQKTRSEASKLQRNLYTRIAPPMPQNGKNTVIISKSPTANMEFLPTTSGTSRVTVNSVVRQRPNIGPSTSSAGTTSALTTSSTKDSSAATSHIKHLSPPVAKSRPPVAPSAPVPSLAGPSPAKFPLRTDTSVSPPQPRPCKPPGQKKDPMASLFVPKHRAHSQLR